MMLIDQIKQDLINNIDHYLINGGKLICKSFYNNNCRCALTCCIDNQVSIDQCFEIIQERWQVEREWIIAFILGYDNHGIIWETKYSEAYQFGQEIRNIYKPSDFK